MEKQIIHYQNKRLLEYYFQLNIMSNHGQNLQVSLTIAKTLLALLGGLWFIHTGNGTDTKGPNGSRSLSQNSVNSVPHNLLEFTESYDSGPIPLQCECTIMPPEAPH